MAKSNHKYRVSVYLGKDMYTRFEAEAKALGVSVATMTRIILETGFQVAKNLEKGGALNGDK